MPRGIVDGNIAVFDNIERGWRVLMTGDPRVGAEFYNAVYAGHVAAALHFSVSRRDGVKPTDDEVEFAVLDMIAEVMPDVPEMCEKARKAIRVYGQIAAEHDGVTVVHAFVPALEDGDGV